MSTRLNDIIVIGPPQGGPKMSGPTPTSCWLIPDVLLWGDTPVSGILTELVQSKPARVRYFLDLSAHPTDYANPLAQWSVIYHKLDISTAIVAASPTSVTRIASALKSFIAECLDGSCSGDVGYMHCDDGHSVSAVAAAAVLSYVYGISGMKAMTIAAQLYGSREQMTSLASLYNLAKKTLIKLLVSDPQPIGRCSVDPFDQSGFSDTGAKMDTSLLMTQSTVQQLSSGVFAQATVNNATKLSDTTSSPHRPNIGRYDSNSGGGGEQHFNIFGTHNAPISHEDNNNNITISRSNPSISKATLIESATESTTRDTKLVEQLVSTLLQLLKSKEQTVITSVAPTFDAATPTPTLPASLPPQFRANHSNPIVGNKLYNSVTESNESLFNTKASHSSGKDGNNTINTLNEGHISSTYAQNFTRETSTIGMLMAQHWINKPRCNYGRERLNVLIKEGPPQGGMTMCGPTPISCWLIPGVLLWGGTPLCGSLMELVQSKPVRVRYFLDLSARPTDYAKTLTQWSVVSHRLDLFGAFLGTNSAVTRVASALKSFLAECLDGSCSGDVGYMHCDDGHSVSAVAAAAVLSYVYNVSDENAITIATQQYESRDQTVSVASHYNQMQKTLIKLLVSDPQPIGIASVDPFDRAASLDKRRQSTTNTLSSQIIQLGQFRETTSPEIITSVIPENATMTENLSTQHRQTLEQLNVSLQEQQSFAQNVKPYSEATTAAEGASVDTKQSIKDSFLVGNKKRRSVSYGDVSVCNADKGDISAMMTRHCMYQARFNSGNEKLTFLIKEGPPQGGPKMSGPTPTSCWLIPDVLLWGDTPVSEILTELVQSKPARVRYFLDLSAHPTDYANPLAQWSVIYHKLDISTAIVAASPTSVTRIASALKSFIAECLDGSCSGDVGYMHCDDGHSVSAVAAAAVLSYVYGISGMKAMTIAAQLYGSREQMTSLASLYNPAKKTLIKLLVSDPQPIGRCSVDPFDQSGFSDTGAKMDTSLLMTQSTVQQLSSGVFAQTTVNNATKLSDTTSSPHRPNIGRYDSNSGGGGEQHMNIFRSDNVQITQEENSSRCLASLLPKNPTEFCQPTIKYARSASSPEVDRKPIRIAGLNRRNSVLESDESTLAHHRSHSCGDESKSASGKILNSMMAQHWINKPRCNYGLERLNVLIKEGPPQGGMTMCGPTPISCWLIPGVLLWGGTPLCGSLMELVQSKPVRVRYFLDLSARSTDYAKTLTQWSVVSHRLDLSSAFAGALSSAVMKVAGTLKSFIAECLDGSCSGDVGYMHCDDGHSVSAVAAAAVLSYVYGISGMKAMTIAAQLYGSREATSVNSLYNPVQKAFIRELVNDQQPISKSTVDLPDLNVLQQQEQHHQTPQHQQGGPHFQSINVTPVTVPGSVPVTVPGSAPVTVPGSAPVTVPGSAPVTVPGSETPTELPQRTTMVPSNNKEGDYHLKVLEMGNNSSNISKNNSHDNKIGIVETPERHYKRARNDSSEDARDSLKMLKEQHVNSIEAADIIKEGIAVESNVTQSKLIVPTTHVSTQVPSVNQQSLELSRLTTTTNSNTSPLCSAVMIRSSRNEPWGITLSRAFVTKIETYSAAHRARIPPRCTILTVNTAPFVALNDNTLNMITSHKKRVEVTYTTDILSAPPIPSKIPIASTPYKAAKVENKVSTTTSVPYTIATTPEDGRSSVKLFTDITSPFTQKHPVEPQVEQVVVPAAEIDTAIVTPIMEPSLAAPIDTTVINTSGGCRFPPPIFQPLQEPALIRGPTAQTNWVIRDCVMCGPIPNPRSKRHFDILARCQFDIFVCLMCIDGSTQYIEAYRNASNCPNAQILVVPLEDGAALSSSVIPLLLNALKQTTEALRNGKKVYIHCLRGHGRTGMFVSLLLGMTYKLSGMRALNLCHALHMCRQETEDKASPETHEQRLSVISLLSQFQQRKE